MMLDGRVVRRASAQVVMRETGLGRMVRLQGVLDEVLQKC